jgi:diguanylate cyclase (GGDEF)-like protein
LDWSKLPDIFAVALLAGAFASVSRHSPTRVSSLWLTGWILIVVHFTAFMFLPAPSPWNILAAVLGLATITWAGLLFMWASVPYRTESSSRWMLLSLLATNTLYLCALELPGPTWLLNLAAVLMGIGPLVVTLSAIHRFNHALRWTTTILYAALAVFLLIVQHRSPNGEDLAIDGVLFTVYFDCCIHFCYMYRRATAGPFITISGFFAWACVFLISPLQQAFFPHAQIESEVWNLPKYVVAVGMILLLLEEQIDHNKHLALHDALTGLPNRRLFEDRLTSALERAKRAQTRAALLVLDLDRFKQVNDSLGHHMGDLLLQRVATLFGTRVRRSDTVARTGGDEFSVILEGPTSKEEAAIVGRSLQDLLREPVLLENRTVRIGASLGVAVFPEDAPDMKSLCITADLRMYDNKRTSGSPVDQDYSKAKKSSVTAQESHRQSGSWIPK